MLKATSSPNKKLKNSEFLFQGEITTQQNLPPAAQLPDINISTYLTPGPLPSPSVSRVESADTRTDDKTDESHVLVSLETPVSSSSSLVFEGLPRHLFVSTDDSTFCQNGCEDDSKLYHDNSTAFMDVFLPEVIQTQGEEVVISTVEMEPAECCSGKDDLNEEKQSTEPKYVKLCV